MREEFGSRAYFPDVINTTFDLPHDIGRVSVSLVVEGADPAVPGTRKRKLTLNGDNGFHNPRVKLPPDLCKKLHNTFKCNICCSSPIKPPVIFSRCCKRLLGCQECMDRWFGGEEGVTRSCPLCRSERAYADTCIVKGLDELLKTIAPLVGRGSVDSDREDVSQP